MLDGVPGNTRHTLCFCSRGVKARSDFVVLIVKGLATAEQTLKNVNYWSAEFDKVNTP